MPAQRHDAYVTKPVEPQDLFAVLEQSSPRVPTQSVPRPSQTTPRCSTPKALLRA